MKKLFLTAIVFIICLCVSACTEKESSSYSSEPMFGETPRIVTGEISQIVSDDMVIITISSSEESQIKVDDKVRVKYDASYIINESGGEQSSPEHTQVKVGDSVEFYIGVSPALAPEKDDEGEYWHVMSLKIK